MQDIGWSFVNGKLGQRCDQLHSIEDIPQLLCGTIQDKLEDESADCLTSHQVIRILSILF